MFFSKWFQNDRQPRGVESEPTPFLQYGLAILSVLAATLLSYIALYLEPSGVHSLFLFYFTAVMVSAWFGGLGPGCVAIGMSTFLLHNLSPYDNSLAYADYVRFLLFMIITLLLSSLHVRRKQAEGLLLAAQEELRIARQIQEQLFPLHSPKIPGFDIAGTTLAATSANGDYYDYFDLVDGSLGVAVGDVSSHGLGPALLMAETRAYLRALALAHDNVGTILTLANHALCEDTHAKHFISVFLARLDPSARTLIYAAAGMVGYIMNKDGSTRELDSTGMPLGIDESETIELGSTFRLQTGQLAIFITDGTYEARSPSGEFFGLERVLRTVSNNRDCSAKEIVDILCRTILDFVGNRKERDDITIVVLKVEPVPVEVPAKTPLAQSAVTESGRM
jgi:serine phosphatase RsbU (regulator of sigma subunit)